MVIEEKFFRLISTDECSPFFDLELLYKIKGKNERMEFKNVGYGMTFEHCVQKIISYALHCKHQDAAIRLKTYLQDYKKELDEFKSLLRGLNP